MMTSTRPLGLDINHRSSTINAERVSDHQELRLDINHRSSTIEPLVSDCLARGSIIFGD